MRLRRLAAILIAGSLRAADPELLNLAMPDAKVMAGVNLEQVKASPLGQYLLAKAAANDSDLEKLMDATGFDPRRDLREILAASNGQAGGHSGLILVRGTLDIGRIVQAALADGKTVDNYAGVNIIAGRDGHGLALLDAATAIAGDTASVRAAIDRRSAPASIDPGLAAQVAQLSAGQDAWFVSLVPPNQFQPQRAGTAGPPPGAFGTLSKVLQARGGIKLGASVVLSVQAVSNSAEDASALAGAVRMLAGMVSLKAPRNETPGFAAILQSLSVSADGPVTRLSLTVPEEQIEQVLDKAHPRSRAGSAQPMQVR